jgi:hypothetical protein
VAALFWFLPLLDAGGKLQQACGCGEQESLALLTGGGRRRPHTHRPVSLKEEAGSPLLKLQGRQQRRCTPLCLSQAGPACRRCVVLGYYSQPAAASRRHDGVRLLSVDDDWTHFTPTRIPTRSIETIVCVSLRFARGAPINRSIAPPGFNTHAPLVHPPNHLLSRAPSKSRSSSRGQRRPRTHTPCVQQSKAKAWRPPSPRLPETSSTARCSRCVRHALPCLD